MRTTLPTSEVHVWYVRTDQIPHAGHHPVGADLLGPDERVRLDKLRVERSRFEFGIKRILARTVLSRYAAVAPQDWIFSRSRYGRPQIEGPEWARSLSFNVSSTPGLVACAVACDHTIGLDVELHDRWDAPASSAARWFAPSEVEDLRRRRTEDRRRRFVEYWTLKEAYVKARGFGLSMPLDMIEFSINHSDRTDIRFQSSVDDDPTDWQFALLQPTSPHLLAIAINRPAGAALQIVVQEAQLAPF